MECFPESHSERVEWAMARRHLFSFRTSSFNPESGMEYRLSELYVALATLGMLDDAFAFRGTCRERLFLAVDARMAGVPIVPHNVYEGLGACCQKDIVLKTVDEMVRQGHHPREQDYEWLCDAAEGLSLTPGLPERTKKWLAEVQTRARVYEAPAYLPCDQVAYTLKEIFPTSQELSMTDLVTVKQQVTSGGDSLGTTLNAPSSAA